MQANELLFLQYFNNPLFGGGFAQVVFCIRVFRV